MRNSGPADTYAEVDVTADRLPTEAPAVGDVVQGKYRLLSLLGSGGMGRVFLAEHVVLRTNVALKFMHPHLASDRPSVGRFMREARAAATLQSEFAARVLDVEHDADGDAGGPYIVMEHLQGRSLDSVGRSRRGLEVASAVKYVIQACDALGEAHARGIVHRDVKPANLFLARHKRGQAYVKVLDFGLAIDNTSEEAAPGRALRALGTPHYMSPEQIRGGSLDHRTDIWSLGVTLQDLLTARPAFEAPTTAQVFSRILDGAPLSLRALRPDVPYAVARIVERCLRKSPSQRFQSTRELARALEAALASGSVASPANDETDLDPARTRPSLPSLTMHTPVGMVLPSLPPPVASTLAPPKRRSSLAALCMPACIAISAAGMALFTSSAGAASAPLLAPAPRAVVHDSVARDAALRSKDSAPPQRVRQAARRGAIAERKSDSPS